MEAGGTTGSCSRFAAVILAAGASRRMGKTNKLFADLLGRPMISWVIETAMRAALSPICVVVGSDRAMMSKALSEYDVRIVENPDHADGMSTSIKAGLKAVWAEDAVEGAFIMLGDMPLIRAKTLKDMADKMSAVPDAWAAVPYYEGRRGNPVLWRKQAFAELMTLRGDQGARTVLSRLGRKQIKVDVGDPAILMDADTPDALARLRAQAGSDGEG